MYIILVTLGFLVSISNGFNMPILSGKARIRTSLSLNRLLFHEDETTRNSNEITVSLNYNDYRAVHLREVLKVNDGDVVKTGVLDVGITNEARVCIDRMVASKPVTIREKRIAKAVLKGKKSLKSIHVPGESDSYMKLNIGPASSLQINEVPPVDLILACPRPIRLERLLPVIACMGVGKLILVGATKVEKSYWGAQLFRQPDTVQNYLEEGLSQACSDYRLPKVIIEQKLHLFLGSKDGKIEGTIDALFPPDEYIRVVAHPPVPSDASSANKQSLGSMRMTQLQREKLVKAKKKVVVAIGPEGGWTDSEMHAFLRREFQPVHAGERVLRTDMAVPALLALAHEYIDVMDK